MLQEVGLHVYFAVPKMIQSWPMWPEIQSRFFITSPNMIRKKYHESNILIGQRKGLPSLVQEQIIVSDNEIQFAKECILLIKKELVENYNNNVWIPFNSILSHSLPSEKGTDVRITNRIFSLLDSDNKNKFIH